jgi:hypothetical protein
MINDDERGAFGGMITGRGNRSTRRKTATLLLCPPQIPYDLTCARTRAAAVGSLLLTARAMGTTVPPVKYRDSVTGQEPFLPDPLQFIIHLSSYHSHYMFYDSKSFIK